MIYQATLETIDGFRKEVAVKLIHRHLVSYLEVMDLFINEAKLGASLDHGNIVRVSELNEHSGDYYIVMEYVDGIDLRNILDALREMDESMSWNLAVYISLEIAKALEYAHSRADDTGVPMGIVHRDLSPSNVMITWSGEVKVLDFGIARALLADEKKSSAVRGKWAYMSPEQVRGEELDGRSDIFSLGVLFYEMLTGQKLFAGRNDMHTMQLVQKAEVPPISGLEPSVKPVLRKMLSEQRSHRFVSAAELMDKLGRALQASSRATTPMTLCDKMRRVSRHLKRSAQQAELMEGESSILFSAEEAKPLAVGDMTAPTKLPEESVEQGPTEEVQPDEPPAEVQQQEVRRTSHLARPSLPLPKTSLPLIHSKKTKAADSPENEGSQAVVEEGLKNDKGFGLTDFLKALAAKDKKKILLLSVLLLSLAAAFVIIWALFPSSKKSRPKHETGKSSAAKTVPRSPNPSRGPSVRPLKSPTAIGSTGPSYPAREGEATKKAAYASESTDSKETGIEVLPLSKEPRSGHLDLITDPEGAVVTWKDRLIGRTPIRLQLETGKDYLFALTKEGRRLTLQKVNLAPGKAKKMDLYLKYVTKKTQKARQGQSGISVVCRTKEIYRIYLNGRDTGYNCPISLRSEPGRQSVGIYLPRQDRILYQYVRVTTGKWVSVDWPY